MTPRCAGARQGSPSDPEGVPRRALLFTVCAAEPLRGIRASRVDRGGGVEVFPSLGASPTRTAFSPFDSEATVKRFLGGAGNHLDEAGTEVVGLEAELRDALDAVRGTLEMPVTRSQSRPVGREPSCPRGASGEVLCGRSSIRCSVVKETARPPRSSRCATGGRGPSQPAPRCRRPSITSTSVS